jgi:hypothetical protein
MAKVTVDVDGHKLTHELTSKDSAKRFNEALKDPGQFKEFAKDPAGFAKSHGVQIDPALAAQLTAKLKGKQSLTEAQRMADDENGGGNFTAGAVAMGAFAASDTKIAAVAI